MASNAAANDGGGGGLRAARRRRIEDVRQMQHQRRREAPQHQPQPQHHQQRHYELEDETHMNMPMPYQAHQQGQGGNDHHYHSGNDGNTMASTPASRAGASHMSKSPCSTSTMSTRRALSAKRQNMMQRRIEMRKRSEERERERLQQQQQQEEEQRPQPADHDHDPYGHGQAVGHQQQQQHQHQHQTQSSQPQHFHDQSQPMPQQKQQQQQQQSYHGQQQSILRNGSDNPRPSGVNYHSSQHQQAEGQQHHYGRGSQGRQQQQQQQQQSHRSPMEDRQQQQSQRPPVEGQHQQQSQPHRPPIEDQRQQQQQPHRLPMEEMQQQQSHRPPVEDRKQQQQAQSHRPPMHDRQHYHHSQSAPQNNQQQQQHGQYARAQSTQPPMAIPSPPMLQRKQQYSQIPVYHRGEGNSSPEDSRLESPPNQVKNEGGVYNQAELEQSGIMRNSNGNASQMLKKFSPYDSPSDEWHSFNNNSYQGVIAAGPNNVQQLPARNQQEKPPQYQQQKKQPLLRPRQSVQSMGNLHNLGQQHNDAPKNNSPGQAVNTPRNRYAHQQQQEQNQQHPHQQYQNQNQPNWNDIDEQYHDANRQRIYQRQLASRQQQQQQQQMAQQNQTQNTQQHPPRKSALSPVEHLGNRTDQIQRKNNGKSPVRHQSNRAVANQQGIQPGKHQYDQPRQAQHQQSHHQTRITQTNSYNSIEGEERSLLSVSNQARKFEAHVSRESHDQQQGQGVRKSNSRSLDPRSLSLMTSSSSPSQQHQLEKSLSNNADEEGTMEELVSVASLRKGWEGKQQQQQQQPRSKSTPRASARNEQMENSPFGVWEERANRLARSRRREQRKEQRKGIEDRWMRQRQTVAVPEKERAEKYHDGYQSEGPSQQRRGYGKARSDNHDGYQSEGGEGQEVQYGEGTSDSLLEVETSAINPQDARRRLWDPEERLRNFEKRGGSFDNMGDVRGRWPEQNLKRNSSQTGSPSNYSGYSGSNASGGQFNSKFARAAALAMQKNGGNEQTQHHQQGVGSSMEKRADSQHPQQQQTQQQQREYENKQNRHEHMQQQQQREYETKQNNRFQTQQYKHHQQHESSSKNNKSSYHPQKGPLAASSHFTDSTAEMSADITTLGDGSSQIQQQQQNNQYASSRKFSPSPPKYSTHQHQSTLTMPPIDETVAATQTSQAQAATTNSSVADLIARINAVSRCNPEEALAAIDSIIKNNGIGGSPQEESCGAPPNMPQESSRGRSGPSATPQDASRGNRVSERIGVSTNNQTLFSPSRALVTPSPQAKNANNSGVREANTVQHLGKAFFQERYEEVLRSDKNKKVLRDDCGQVIRGPLKREDQFDNEQEDGEEDSLLSSSDESTVSSMTNPTYASMRSEQLQKRNGANAEQRGYHRMFSRNVTDQQQQQQPPEYLQEKPQKSWNTLKSEYNVRKSSHSTEGKTSKAVTRTSSNDIGLEVVEEFNPDDMVPEQPQTIAKSGTDELATGHGGFCGIAPCDSGVQQPNVNHSSQDAPPTPPTPSTLTNTDWVPIPNKAGLFGGNVNNRGVRRPNGPTQGNARWPFMGNAPPRQNKNHSNGNNLDLPRLIQGQKRSNATTTNQQVPASASSASLQLRRSIQSNNSNAPLPRHRTITPRTPEPKSNGTEPMRASTPEIMMAVTDAFSNVNISLEGSRPAGKNISAQETRTRPIVGNSEDDPPLQGYASPGEEEDLPQVASLQTISEAFSDVDIDFEQKNQKSVGQRRKQLEYLAKSWTASKTQSQDGSGSTSEFKAPSQNTSKIGAHQQPQRAATTWASSPQKSTRSGTTATSKGLKKRAEPTLRLKGNKSLAKKFANLVNAYDD